MRNKLEIMGLMTKEITRALDEITADPDGLDVEYWEGYEQAMRNARYWTGYIHEEAHNE